MGWAVGTDPQRRRHIGYGVPSICDRPGCGERIDRGLAYACGGGVVGSGENCGLFFCEADRQYMFFVEDEWVWEDGLTEEQQKDESIDYELVCERCGSNLPPFDPTPDTAEWAHHVLSDESWEQWRNEEPEWANEMRLIEAAAGEVR